MTDNTYDDIQKTAQSPFMIWCRQSDEERDESRLARDAERDARRDYALNLSKSQTSLATKTHALEMVDGVETLQELLTYDESSSKFMRDGTVVFNRDLRNLVREHCSDLVPSLNSINCPDEMTHAAQIKNFRRAARRLQVHASVRHLVVMV